MDLSRQSPAPTRYVGIGLVVALHLAGIYALSAGLIRPMTKPHEVTTLKPLPPDVHEPPPPTRPLIAEAPTLLNPPMIPVPVPPIVIETPNDPPLITGVPLQKDSGPTNPGSTPRTEQPPIIAKPTGVQTPGAVCSVMPRPDVPVVSWSGEAVLNVVATVRGGRVVGSEFRVTQGALDSKSRRALQRSVESALAGYQCQGDATFQQDFAFRLD